MVRCQFFALVPSTNKSIKNRNNAETSQIQILHSNAEKNFWKYLSRL